MGPNLLTVEEKQRIIEKVQEILPYIECPICHNKHFVIADGYFNTSIQGQLNGMMLGGPSIPSIGLICNKCGFISHHALGVLGLLPEQNDQKENTLKTNNK